MSAYDVVEVRWSWGGSALLTFGLLAAFLAAVAFLARAYRGFHFWAVVVVIVVPLVSLVGTVLGLVGLRRASGRSAALWGVILNLATFASCIAAFVLSRAGL